MEEIRFGWWLTFKCSFFVIESNTRRLETWQRSNYWRLSHCTAIQLNKTRRHHDPCQTHHFLWRSLGGKSETKKIKVNLCKRLRAEFMKKKAGEFSCYRIVLNNKTPDEARTPFMDRRWSSCFLIAFVAIRCFFPFRFFPPPLSPNPTQLSLWESLFRLRILMTWWDFLFAQLLHRHFPPHRGWNTKCK